MTKEKQSLSTLLEENRSFAPSKAFQQQANINDPAIYEKAARDPEAYWAEWAKQLDWIKPWDKVLEWNPPFSKWFVGGQLNACANCVDRHVTGPDSIASKVAIQWEGEPGDKRTFTYADLHKEVNRFGSALRKLGVQKGDRIAIYLPMVPEAVIACLASARIGAIHSVVFGGFSAESLRDRINDSKCKILITADFGWRRGKHILLKQAADEALVGCESIENVVVVERERGKHATEPVCEMTAGRDHWWHDVCASADEVSVPEAMDSEDMLYILYTSGTTGKPKGIVHTTGGYMTSVYATTQWVFDLKPNDVYWCMADVGWVTGHSYVIYGPLANGASVFIYEGAPDFPDKGRTWQLIQDYGVSILYTAPTAIRAFMKWGVEWPEKADLSSLRLLGSVGEPINPEAWMWYHKNIGKEKCPVVDTWWQTETGAIMITPLPGITTTKPGSASRPFPGVSAEVLNESGERIEVGGGFVSLTKPWPSMLRTIYGDEQRYIETYWSKWGRDTYFPGDGVKRDQDGDFWFMGRVDDVMNVSGHRIGTMEVESALVDHQSVAEAAVVSKPHEIKGEGICAFVTLKQGVEPSPEMEATLKQHVTQKIGAIARPEEIIFTADLPKTRSGKIMRRLLRDIATGKTLGDTTTLADPAVVEKLIKQHESAEN